MAKDDKIVVNPGRGGLHIFPLNPTYGKTKINPDELYPKCFFEEFITQITNVPKQYIFNGNATILIFDDNSKVVVKTMEGDEFDPVMGFLTAFFQKYSGLSKNKANDYLVEVRKKYEETHPLIVKEVIEIGEPVKFQNGDRVEVINASEFDESNGVKVGDIGTINDLDDDMRCPMISFDNGKRHPMYSEQLKLIERKEDK